MQIPFGAQSTADDVLKGVHLAGKAILVTGCTRGIGFETMRVLAAHGARVIGLGRTLDAAQEACSRASGPTTPVACDLEDYSSIVAAVTTIRAFDRPLDAIVANAGILCPILQLRYGIESQFLVNHIGHFVLINRLLDLMLSKAGRIVIVSSSASVELAPKEGIMFDNLNGNRFYEASSFYGQSKLANALFAKDLSRRLHDRGVTVNSLHPGAVDGTGLRRSLGSPISLSVPTESIFKKSIPQGAATQVFLAASPLASGITGEYWVDCHIAKGSKYLLDPHMASRLWTASEKIVTSHTRVVERAF